MDEAYTPNNNNNNNITEKKKYVIGWHKMCTEVKLVCTFGVRSNHGH